MVKQSSEERNRKRRQNYAIARKKLAMTRMVRETVQESMANQERRRLQRSALRQGIDETMAAERTSRLISELDGTLPCEASLNATLNFEQSCKDVRVSHCLCCRQVRLQLSMNVRRGVCHECSNLKDKNYYIDRNLLPIWYKEGHVQYGVPPELTCLTLAEKMLIQLASPFIPLQHIKNGVFGLSGHVCSFEQDVEKFVTTLPRHPSEVTVLKVLKEVAVEVGGCETRTSVFTVRRKNVGDALKWLKKYNIEYRNIPIDMSALDWLGGDEGSLDSVLTINSCSPAQETDTAPLDLGPSPSLTMGTQQSGDNIQTFGYVNESLVTHLSSEDTDIHNQLVQEIQGSSRKKEIEVQWPSTGPVAINEYSTTRIFARAFPWLFPGGVGDAKDAEDQLQKWGQRLLYYEDGRFAKDKYFTFYAYNYIVRHRNAKSGSWFLKGFNRNGPETLAELQASIRSGNLEFINRLMYYNKHVTGSNSYWYQKRAEVYTWINHHVEVGNGPPNLFITLSCAEYYWPDMLRVILERMEIAGDTRVKDCYQGSPKLTELLNDYTIVVQEFFQVRFENWMEHFGRPVFGIRHYWGRYEFAPGRGQIHIHLLAIRKDQAIFKLLYDDLRQPDGKALRDRRLAKWAEDELGLTASVADGFEGRSAQPKDSPCSVRFCDLSLVGSPHTDVTQGLLDDQQNLIKFCQVHDCNGFCLRKKGNKRQRTCRCGAGTEATESKGDTPGFPLSDVPTVLRTHQRCQQLRMPRNHRRINQTSTKLLQAWRGNCDVQILIYESHPDNFDPCEVSKVTDYVVAYSCKGNTSYREETEMNKHIILKAEEVTGDSGDLRSLCRHLANKASSSRLVSKAEASVLLGGLDLVVCSDLIDSVSISNSIRISQSNDNSHNKSFLWQYTHRSGYLEKCSLHDFYSIFRSCHQGKKPYIPHYIGVKGQPTYPVSEAYARHVLTIYKPWRTYPTLENWKVDFERFIRSPECPMSAKLTYKRVLQRFFDGTKFVEATAKAQPAGDANEVSQDDQEILALAGLSLSDDSILNLDLNSIKRGRGFDFARPPKERALLTVYPVLPEIWLETAIEDYKNRDDATLNIPLKFDGQPYSIDDLVEEQKRNIYPVLAKLREFMTCLRMVLFCPLFGTICGKAGAGKSTVLNTLTGTIRNLFQYNNTTITGGPTGTSAFNAFGETCHRILGQGINGEYYPNSLSLATRERLLKRCKHLLCLIIDERSLLSSKMLGTTAQIISEVIFDGGTAKEFFGGIPIVLLVGDDYQIPGQQEGALTALSRVGGSRMTQKGRQVFLRCAENVFQLQSIQRVSDSQREAKEMLDRVRIGENVLDKDVRKIQSLHLNAIREKHGDDYVKEIENEAVYLFWTNEKRAQRNLFRLGETNTDQNPTVIVKPISQGGKYGIGIASHFQDKLPPASMLCVNARVCIQGCNFYPTWGLHNGACGTVQEIIFEEGKDPNKGDHPKYVVVNFPQYIGPTWDADRPKDVPIPIITRRCEHKCCQRTFLPLELAFGRTLHRFQGQSAGKVDKGKIPNATPVIVCDPDVSQVEGRSTGFFYTMLSRATTFGDETGLNSAIYFTGPHLTKERIQRLTVRSDNNKTLINVQRRTNWVEHLTHNTVDVSKISPEEMEDVFRWATTTKYSYDELYRRTQEYISTRDEARQASANPS